VHLRKEKLKKRHFSLLPFGRQLSSRSLESKTSVLTAVAWEVTITPNELSSSPFLALLLLRAISYGME